MTSPFILMLSGANTAFTVTAAKPVNHSGFTGYTDLFQLPRKELVHKSSYHQATADVRNNGNAQSKSEQEV